MEAEQEILGAVQIWRDRGGRWANTTMMNIYGKYKNVYSVIVVYNTTIMDIYTKYKKLYI